MKPKFFYLSLLFCLPLCSFLLKSPQDNQAPIVKITNPQPNASFDPAAPISYKITVSDKEDGESKFDEINVKEVLLEVKYISAKSKPLPLSKTVPADPPGLAVMRTSNCFNCHNFNSKSIGPSFYDIGKRYPTTKANTDSLIKRIKQGSAGIWEGREKMPAHPELSADEIKSTVQWIMKNALNPDVTYYIGTEGTFKVDPSKKGSYLLTASYIDHGQKNNPKVQRLKGQDVVVIVPKK